MLKLQKPMTLENCSFEYKRMSDKQVECFIITPDNNKFSILINATSQPPNQWVFDLFGAKNKEFILNLDSEII